MLGVKKKQMFFVLLTGADISERFSYMFVKSFITKWVGIAHHKSSDAYFVWAEIVG